jgi:hypothetical protein
MFCLCTQSALTAGQHFSRFSSLWYECLVTMFGRMKQFNTWNEKCSNYMALFKTATQLNSDCLQDTLPNVERSLCLSHREWTTNGPKHQTRSIRLHSFLTLPLHGDKVTRFTLWPFYPPERDPGTHWTGCWLHPRSSLDILEKSLVPVGNQTLDHTAQSLWLGQPSYCKTHYANKKREKYFRI